MVKKSVERKGNRGKIIISGGNVRISGDSVFVGDLTIKATGSLTIDGTIQVDGTLTILGPTK